MVVVVLVVVVGGLGTALKCSVFTRGVSIFPSAGFACLLLL